jgi:hypothetical protein
LIDFETFEKQKVAVKEQTMTHLSFRIEQLGAALQQNLASKNPKC